MSSFFATEIKSSLNDDEAVSLRFGDRHAVVTAASVDPQSHRLVTLYAFIDGLRVPLCVLGSGNLYGKEYQCYRSPLDLHISPGTSILVMLFSHSSSLGGSVYLTGHYVE